MKDTLLNIFVFVLFFLSVFPTSAAGMPIRQQIRRDIRQGVMNGSGPGQIINNIKETVRVTPGQRPPPPPPKPNLWQEIKDFITNLRYSAHITGAITAINDKVFTVKTSNNKTYQVYVSDKTQLRRRFWGMSSLSEFSVGDTINVVGKWKDSAKTQIDAIIIKNLSVQKRHGIFIGDVTSINSPSFMMKTVNRGNLTVTTDGRTLFVQRDGKPATFGQMQVGHRVRVDGIWNVQTNNVSGVTQIKDYTVPTQ